MPAAPSPAPVPHAYVASLLDTVLSYEFSLRHRTLLPQSWQAALADQFTQPYFQKLEKFVAEQRHVEHGLPRRDERVQRLSSDAARTGQGGASGRRAAGQRESDRRPGVFRAAWREAIVRRPRMFEELHRDLGCWPPSTGHLAPWARQGVLLLNRVLTVREGEPGSHQRKGWETFTDAVLAL